MASYDLNEKLKARENEKKQQEEFVKEGEIALDDVSRVKVLSPGRKVFKRFIRNRLAVFGSVTLIILFVFSFLGPLVYKYGQKEIFYTYSTENVEYGLAKTNTTYTGYNVDESVNIETTVVNAMNSNIKKMISNGNDTLVVSGENGGYEIDKVADSIYTLSTLEITPVATIGNSTVEVGTYNSIKKEITFNSVEVEGLG